MSSKKKKYLTILTIVLVIAVGLHFVPVYSQNGYIDAGLGTVCVGVNGVNPEDVIVNDDHRLVLGGLGGFKDDKKQLTSKNPNTCAPQLRLRLFIL